MKNFPKNNSLVRNKGFTLIELMVALSIYIIMSVILLASQDKFNSSISFSNLGYDIALTMRQAQTYGYAVRTNATGTFANAFGLHFAANQPTGFTLFYEPIIAAGPALPSTGIPLSYSACQQSSSCQSGYQQVSTYNLQNGFQISKICYGQINDCGSATASNPGSCVSVSATDASNNFLDIVFQRPNTNAFLFNANNNCQSGNQCLVQAAVELTSPTGDKECISIFQSGDIEVSPTSAVAPSSS